MDVGVDPKGRGKLVNGMSLFLKKKKDFCGYYVKSLSQSERILTPLTPNAMVLVNEQNCL